MIIMVLRDCERAKLWLRAASLRVFGGQRQEQVSNDVLKVLCAGISTELTPGAEGGARGFLFRPQDPKSENAGISSYQ